MRFVAGRAAVADCPDSYGKDASGADAYWPGRRGGLPMPPTARKETGLAFVGADDFGNVDEVVCNTLGIAGHL